MTILRTNYPISSSDYIRVARRYQYILEEFYDQGCYNVAIPFFPNSILKEDREDVFDDVQNVITDFLRRHDMMIYLILDEKHDINIHNSIQEAIELETLEPIYTEEIELRKMSENVMMDAVISHDHKIDIKDIDKGFIDTLFDLIDASGESDPDIYKRANKDRKYFSKMKRVGYKPTKSVAIAFAIALRLDFEDSLDLIERAGFTLSKAIIFDKIIAYCIKTEEFNIHNVNQILYKYDQELL